MLQSAASAVGLDPLQIEGLGNRLTGDRQLQGQAPGVQRCLRPRRPLLRRAGLQIVRMGEEGRDNGGDERGMQERLHRAGALGVDLVQAMDRFVQLDAQFHLPADPVEVGHLPRTEAGWQIREEKAIALRRVDPDQAEMERIPGPRPAHRHRWPGRRAQDLLVQQDIEVGAGEKLLRDLPAGDIVHLGLPIVLEADDKTHPMGVTGPQPGQAGIRQVSEQAVAPPGLVDLQMPAIMLSGRAEMVAHRGPAADGEDFMDLERRIVASPGELVPQGIAHADRRGIDDVPVLDPQRCPADRPAAPGHRPGRGRPGPP